MTEATKLITDTTEDYTSASSSLKEDAENQDDKEQVIRHLLEASDDELGIPNREDVFEFEQV
ncbi:putative 30S ribosomal protein S2 [Hibiscus syriacus]|uniref:30S ribosomal protein S2 n=1 Tax=Hibiscus syriacus TaxID=106335 RepID=A0A6A2YIN4_HIBSY|nr:putative 30S ribosomal protein S2 [Hibiscus syriacus]